MIGHHRRASWQTTSTDHRMTCTDEVSGNHRILNTGRTRSVGNVLAVGGSAYVRS
jgi:hypothetical protein